MQYQISETDPGLTINAKKQSNSEKQISKRTNNI